MRYYFLFLFSFLSPLAFSQHVKKEVHLDVSVTGADGTASDSVKLIIVTLRNNTDSLVSIYETWNSYGAFAVKLELEVHDTVYCLYSKGDCWNKNYASSIMLFPGDCVDLDFGMVKCTRETCFCFYSMSRELKFPRSGLAGARLSAVYGLGDYDIHQENIEWEAYLKCSLMRPLSHEKEFSKLSLKRKHRSFLLQELKSEPAVLNFDTW